MKNTAVVDAGPLIALFDKSDEYHQKAVESIKHYRAKSTGKLITTWPIISEVAYLLNDHVHLQASLDFFTWIIEGGVEVYDFEIGHLSQVVELQKKYSDIPMDFADATLVVTAQNLGVDKVFSIDKDFLIYKIFGKKHFKNILQG